MNPKNSYKVKVARTTKFQNFILTKSTIVMLKLFTVIADKKLL